MTPWPFLSSRLQPVSPRVSEPSSPIPQGAAQRAARGRALVEREYSARRYAEKVARAYAAVEAAVG